MLNPHISPIDAMIAPDLSRLRVPATESIAIFPVEEQIGRTADLQTTSLWFAPVGPATLSKFVPDKFVHGVSRPQGCVQGRTQ